MLRLRLLGALEISASDGRSLEPVIRRSHRAALLAYLAAASPVGFHRRDKLVALFWPESSESHARGALNQALYVLRTNLGEDAISARGDEVALNAETVWRDTAAFEMALDQGRAEEALALYRGDLLDGFHIANAPEFERWMDRERSRLRSRAGDAAWALAESMASRGNVVEATRWATQAADFQPADESVVRRLMKFLRDHGDRAAAIRVYEDFVALLSTEYDMPPSAETASLANAIREEVQPPQPIVLPPKIVREQPAAVAPPSEHRLRSYSFVALAALLLATLALLIARPNGPGTGRRQPRLAVLPFHNLGATEEKYFADQMTDEVISRLAMMNGVVIVRGRSALAQTGDLRRRFVTDLDVDYVLEGSVKSERSGRRPVEVRFTPRLVRVSDEALVWSDRYTTTTLPGEIFRTQTDIAEGVARALNMTLRDRERLTLAAQPTNDPFAYDFYLRGQQYAAGFSEQETRLAVEMYERAIAADSNFALAHARLAMAHALAYWFFYDRSHARITAARLAAERALALAPNLPDAHLALGYYLYWGQFAYADALREFARAQSLGMNTAELFKSIGNVQRRQGKVDEAIANFERAYVRDPRDMDVTFNLAQAYTLRRALVQADYYFDRVILLNPQVAPAYWNKARLHLNVDGQTKGARAALEMPGAPTGDSVIQYHAALIDMFDRRYERALERLRSSSATIENQWRFVPRAQLEAAIHGLRGRDDLARALYDSARVMSEQKVRVDPGEANGHSALAIAYAGLGRKREAVAEAKRAVELLPVSLEAWRGLYRLEDLARVYAMVGDHDAALSELERLVKLPGGRSIPLLELDPAWDSLRGDPRFRVLLAPKS
jgi:DNA-binding SARP family transcriptional activator/TolB-like protein/Tfp pilus assembly protein PilF